MNLHDWTPDQRPRERLAAAGAHGLSEAELLAIWLGRGTPQRNAVELAHDLLATFGSLRGLLTASAERLSGHPGIGPARLAQLQVLPELARRHFRQTLIGGPALTDPRLARDFLVSQLRDLPYEAFCVIYLDSRHRVTGFEQLFRGTLDRAQVHPREVLRRAMEVRAAAVILCHNHPSGVAEPSTADEQITVRLRDALALVDIRVVDHLIVADGTCVSLAERGLV
jgi:DNA repair protein RadC